MFLFNMADNPLALEVAEAVITSRRLTRPGIWSGLAPKRTPLLVQKAAIQYNTSKSVVQQTIDFLGNLIVRDPRRPLSLTDNEDNVLVTYVHWV